MTALRRGLWALLTLLAVGALILASVVLPRWEGRDDSLTVSGATTLICPSTDPKVSGTNAAVFASSGELSASELDGAAGVRKAVPLNTVATWQKLSSSLELTTAKGGRAVGTAMTSMTEGSDRGLALSRCKTPATEHFFVGLHSNKTTITSITLTNVDENDADIDLSFYSELGRLQAAGSRSVTVKAGSSITVGLEALFNQPGPIAVKVKATQGRVAAFARTHALSGTDSSARGVEWFPSVLSPRYEMVIPGIPTGPGERRLVLGNFSDKRAEVQVKIVGPTSTYTVPGAATLGVNAEAVASLDVAKAMDGQGGAIHLISSAPIVASVTTTSSDDTLLDIANAVTTTAIDQAAALPLPSGGEIAATVALSNVDAVPAEVEIVIKDAVGTPIGQPIAKTIAPNTAMNIEIPGRPTNFVIEVQRKTGTVYGAVVARADGDKAKGLSILPLTSIETAEARIRPINDHRDGE